MKRKRKRVTRRKSMFGTNGAVTITVAFSVAERDEIEQRARAKSRSMSNWVREIVVARLSEERDE